MTLRTARNIATACRVKSEPETWTKKRGYFRVCVLCFVSGTAWRVDSNKKIV